MLSCSDYKKLLVAVQDEKKVCLAPVMTELTTIALKEAGGLLS